MKTLTFTIGFCMVVVLYTHAQKAKKHRDPEQKQFEKAYAYFDDGDLSNAALEFRKFIEEYPQSQMVPRAHYNVAYINYQLKDYGTAKTIFQEILTKPYNEHDLNSLMEPYTLFKHRSSRHLAEIAILEKDYESAEEYIEMFDKKYPYKHFCGNEWAAYHQEVALMRAQVYEGMNQLQKALEVLLPRTFNEFLVSNDEVLDRLIYLLENNYSKESIREELTSSLKSLKVEVNGNATLMLYGVKVQIWTPRPTEGRLTKDFTGQEYYRDIARENRLYKTFL